jgi:TraM recognition site of TraD and TraG
MRAILLGHERDTRSAVRVPKKSFATHWHLIGGTGKGKTTAIHTLLHQLLLDPVEDECFFIFDRMGNLSHELLLWMASDFCTEDVRRRLVYIEPAREDVVLGFNPLLYDTPAHGYYKVSRATEIILRAWEDVNIEAMPRLARWTFNAFWAAAQLGLTIADCVHLLMPGSPYHAQLLQCLPERLKYEWSELLDARSGEATRILDSSRNRLKPYFESDILRRMFGATESRLDVLRFMREGKIVVLNLAPGNRLSSQLANAIGALVLNEVLTSARSLPRGVRYPTYLLLDEFQNFVGPDIDAALPEVRQLGIRLLLSHQSFSQLKRGDYDLTSMIFQAQSRLVFGVQGEDADLLAHELASITYNPKRVKDEVYTRRQLVTGHRVTELASWSNAEAFAEQWNKTYGSNWANHENVVRRDGSRHDVRGEGESRTRSEADGKGGSQSRTATSGKHETLVPEYEQFLELASRTYYTFEEQKSLWAQAVRNLRTGEALLRLVDDPRLYALNVKRDTPGHLGWDAEVLYRELPEALEDVDRLIEENFRSELFASPAAIEAETEKRLQAVLRPVLRLQSPPRVQPVSGAAGPDPFLG